MIIISVEIISALALNIVPSISLILHVVEYLNFSVYGS